MFNNKLFYGMLLGSSILATSCSQKTSNPMWNNQNPFFSESKLPYHTADFSKIKSEDFKPALLQGMVEQLAEIEKIANNSAKPTFENTLVEMEKSGQLLARVSHVFGLLTGADTNETLQAVEEELSPKFAAHSDAIYLNDQLFKRVKALHDAKSTLNLDKESARLLDVYYQKFELAGANLSSAQKEELKKLNGEIASLETKFSNQLLKGTKAGGVAFSKEELVGLSDADLESFKQADGTYLVSLLNTTQQPELQNMTSKASRKKLFDAAWIRTEKKDENDTRATILTLVKKRAEKAKLLGFNNYAEWNLQDQMAQNPTAAKKLLNQMIPAATAMANKDAKEFEALAKKENSANTLTAADWNFYAEKVRKEKYDIDESAMKPYFVLDSVVENGVFYMAKQLYGISFKKRTDIPVWNEDVKVYELFNEDGSQLGLFYTDYFKRDTKQGGAWMSNLVEQSHLFGTKPVIYNVGNYTKPANGQPALISYDDVITTFHEFGHALHGFFANQKYPTLSGTSVSRDFVEFPSQFHEHYATEPSILKNYAKHYQTNQVIPDELVAKMKKAANFNKGYSLTELLSAASLDLSWHTVNVDANITSVDEFEKQALIDNKTNLPQVPPRYRSSYFSHIFGGGYAAGYFAYIWAEMLDHDAYQWTLENGGMTRKNGQILRDKVFSQGNSDDLNVIYKNFRGKEPSIEPMLKYHGLK
ncbi:peptidyl-dipeptidase Dcp [Chishuiella changwenlii]|uniref:Dipeptidyl carboxypeptidase n=1 Tax=Chishuiella changwenlii TaxID=1434701 RepID=A0A1M7BJG1_9FLAO|nr:M3 family metallopeptidase [Chishuiella changwenlii]GGF02538.1 dipeptidyl carboxypeptidase II [Chishuiella changwenlii]SHL55091.1 peptidyl-dipeptidase Dcp [Chishuiella changwenlii]